MEAYAAEELAARAEAVEPGFGVLVGELAGLVGELAGLVGELSGAGFAAGSLDEIE